jgi:hypothetical protein
MLFYHLKINKMKSLILRTLLFVILIASVGLESKAQFGLGADIGVSSKAPTAGLHVIYQVPSDNLLTATFEYDQRVHIDNRNAAYFGFRAGPVFNLETGRTYITALAGSYYRLVSTDYKSLNSWDIGAGLRYVNRPLTFETFYVNKTYSVTVGLVAFHR